MKRHWPVGAEVAEAEFNGGRMLYDTLRTSNFSPEFFEPDYWRKHGAIDGTARGRGTTWFIRAGDSSFVLRHYRRGGLAAKISKDRYWFGSDSETRSFAEWYLTYHLYRAGLPVPVPIAARYVRHGAFYSADLITQRIENSESLAQALLRGPLPLTRWIAIGRVLRRFHDAGVHHADLNAHNILLTPEHVHVIDFDRGTLRKRGWWADSTLVRLYRSLEKVTLLDAPDSFTDEDWHGLLAGYRESAGLPQASLT
ncbi:MAG TPA: 3-deoxy-D-manno-octulosonic acid kinase [Steroidobacteraceae bacterium]|nr:3-deoxy-D-manno-octulosonic acid kinase [Steroidobacteraceae bacterium]